MTVKAESDIYEDVIEEFIALYGNYNVRILRSIRKTNFRGSSLEPAYIAEIEISGEEYEEFLSKARAVFSQKGSKIIEQTEELSQ